MKPEDFAKDLALQFGVKSIHSPIGFEAEDMPKYFKEYSNNPQRIAINCFLLGIRFALKNKILLKDTEDWFKRLNKKTRFKRIR